MEPNKFQLLATTSLWLAGLYGVLFVLGYLVQQQRKEGEYQSGLWGAPRLMAPLYFSLGLFCAGLAIRSYLLPPVVLLSTVLSAEPLLLALRPWAVAAGWALLALLLVLQAFITAVVGLRYGWDAIALRGRSHDWDEHSPGTPSPVVQWLAFISLVWVIVFMVVG